MRLDFKALWIDDQPRHVESFADAIRRRLRDLGFELKVQSVEALDKIDDAIGDHIHDDGIDLVLVDYDLGQGGAGGEKALAQIRERLPHKEVIFYSADDRERLRKIAFDAKIDGLNFSTRLSLADDTYSVIERMLHKIMDIDHMRGVVMSATSDIDFLVEKSIVAIYERMDGDKKKQFVDKILVKLKEKLDRWAVDLSKAEGEGGLAPLFELKHLCSAADRMDLLLGELKSLTPGGSLLGLATEYRNKVVPRRNKLAHVTLRVDADGKRVLDGPAGPVTDKEMTELRCELIEHRINFTDIAVLVDVEMN